MSARHAATLAVCGLVAAAVVATGAPASGQVVRVEHYDPSTTPARGPTSALVTIELFFAPSINGANRLPAYRRLAELQARHPTRIRIIYRIVRRGAQPPGPQLPTLALEAYAQGMFSEFIDELFGQRSTMTRDQMIELARRVGLDPQRAERAITEDRYGEVLTDNERRLERLRGTTSPMVFFNAKPARGSLSSMSERDYETAYLDAYDRARDLLDRGIARRDLMAAFEADGLSGVQPAVPVTAIDDTDPGAVGHPLADPPLQLGGLPTFGDPDASVPVPVIVICRPNDAACNQTLRVLRNIHNTYRGDIRLVWAPWFEVTRDDAADLTLLGDAALCAEKVGSNPDDLDASPGWQWITETYTQIARKHGRRTAPDRLIDDVAKKLRIDSRALSACRARTANTTLDWIAAARSSGVAASPAVVIGGRIYHGLNDHAVIRQLVEAELAPGVLGRCATTGC